ncbi:MAG: putative ABC transport system permease protein [Marinoscillum sp.]|jgi:putative ABC transport system permease protein
MTKEYAVSIILGYVISVPLGAQIMNNWLNNFYYHIDIQVWHYLASLLLILTISGLTVGYKSYKSAAANPVDDLQYE